MAALPPRAPYDFYQSLTHLTISILARDALPAPASSAAVAGSGSELHLQLALQGSSQPLLLDLQLFDAVEPVAELLIRPARTEVRLAKLEAARYMWPSLERGSAAVPAEALRAKVGLAGSSASSSSSSSAPSSGSPAVPAAAPEAGAAAAAAAAPAPSSASSSSAAAPAKKKDWSALEKELAAEEAAAEKPGEGEEALMALFRTIYSGGDEDTRRAMIKSFQTSGGTVLSTNWKEVQKEKYEEKIKPAEGQEFKKF
jgi:hypothetical protein